MMLTNSLPAFLFTTTLASMPLVFGTPRAQGSEVEVGAGHVVRVTDFGVEPDSREDAVKGVRAAIAFAAGWGGFVWLLSLVFGDPVAGIFSDNPVVISVVTDYIRIVFPSYIFLGMVFTVTYSLNALHKPLKSLVLSVLRMFVLYVPMALIGSAVWGLTGVWWAAFSANIVSGLAAIVWFRYIFGKMEMGSAEKAGSPSVVTSPEPETSPA